MRNQYHPNPGPYPTTPEVAVTPGTAAPRAINDGFFPATGFPNAELVVVAFLLVVVGLGMLFTTKRARRHGKGGCVTEMEWHCESDAVGITTTHCEPASPIHTDPCGWHTVRAATESSVAPACIVPHHWVDEIVGGTHDGGLPEDPRAPCMTPEAAAQARAERDAAQAQARSLLGELDAARAEVERLRSEREVDR